MDQGIPFSNLGIYIHIFIYINLGELHVELANGGVAVSLNELMGAGDRRGGLGEITVDDRLNTRVAKREDLFAGGEDHQGDFSTAESAKFAGLFEEARAAFREGHLEIAFIIHFHHLHLLATLARSWHG